MRGEAREYNSPNQTGYLPVCYLRGRTMQMKILTISLSRKIKVNSFVKMMHASISVIAIIILVMPGSGLGWSSKDLLLFERVHQKAIENVLKNKVNSKDLKILQDQQVIVDNAQKAEQSFKHAMTGIKSGQQENIERPIFIQEANNFVKNNLNKAIDAFKDGHEQEAYEFLGKAIHTLQDGTSPAHNPFQTWSDDEGIVAIAVHLSKERIYPDDKSVRAKLEGVVQWAYDIFVKNVTLPDNYFDTDGQLLLPSTYLK